MSDPGTEKESLRHEIETVIRDELRDMAAGISADISAFAAEIATDLTQAILTNDAELLSRLKNQTELLALKHKLRLGKVGRAYLLKTVETVFAILSGALSKGILKI